MKCRMLKYISIFVVIALLMVLFIRKNNSKTVFYDYPLNDYIIVLDAGHGGEDGGAIGIKTLSREKDINLSITLKIGRLLESVGATVILTRENKDALSKNGFNKMKDMRSRAEIIELSRPYIVVSIHCNSFPQSQNVHGAQVFYYPGSETGKLLAQSIQDSIKNNVDNQNLRQIKSEDFYMLRHGNSTNVMVECGFLSCPEEEQLLLNDSYQNKLAYAVFDGIVRYINKITQPANI